MFAFANSIVKFNELNYGEWSEKIWFTLGVIECEFTIGNEESSAITIDISECRKSHKWANYENG